MAVNEMRALPHDATLMPFRSYKCEADRTRSVGCAGCTAVNQKRPSYGVARKQELVAARADLAARARVELASLPDDGGRVLAKGVTGDYDSSAEIIGLRGVLIRHARVGLCGTLQAARRWGVF